MSDLSTLTIFPQQSCLVSPPAGFLLHPITEIVLISGHLSALVPWYCTILEPNPWLSTISGLSSRPLSLNYTFTPCQIISYLQIIGNQQESMNLQAKSWVQFSTNPQLCPTGYSSGYIVSYSGYSKCQKNMHE